MAGVGDVPVLLPYQRRWLDDRSPLKVCVKSRQIGISWTAALEGVLVAGACRQAGGMNVWYMVHTEDDAKEWIEDVAWWARVLQIGFEGRRERILTADGHPISIETVRFASPYR
jgi:phage FluMu gp28-like protein